jgi:membrane protein EpsK
MLRNEAKSRFVANITSNFAAIVVTSFIGLWLTPYYQKNLGTAVYGMIPLVASVVQYFDLCSLSISGAVGRFVAIHLNRQEIKESNVYFNSALFAILLICLLLAVPVIVFSLFLPKIIKIPVGYEMATIWLFLFTAFSSFNNTINSPFLVSTFVRHRFDLANIRQIGSKILQLLLIIVFFNFFSKSLVAVGFSFWIMTGFLLAVSFFLTRQLTPEIQIHWKYFEKSSLHEMGAMGFWMVIDQIGALLYLSINLLMINIFLGPESGGQYAPILQLVTFMITLGGAIGGVFTPIAYEYIAKNQLDTLAFQMKRSTKFMGLAMAYPIGILCGLSEPLLRCWLGVEFSFLSPLVWLMISQGILTIVVNPMFAINRGFNRVKVPSFLTILGGVINVGLSVILLKYSSLGLYAVALSTTFCLLGKNFFFTPVYSAYIMKRPWYFFYRSLLPGIISCSIISLSILFIAQTTDLATYPRLMIITGITGIVYAVSCWGLAMNSDEREVVISLVRRSKFNRGGEA